MDLSNQRNHFDQISNIAPNQSNFNQAQTANISGVLLKTNPRESFVITTANITTQIHNSKSKSKLRAPYEIVMTKPVDWSNSKSPLDDLTLSAKPSNVTLNKIDPIKQPNFNNLSNLQSEKSS